MGTGGENPGEKGVGSVWEAGSPRYWEAGEKGKGKRYTTLLNVLQSKKSEEAYANKNETHLTISLKFVFTI